MDSGVIEISKLGKKYRLGAIGGNTLNAEIQSWWARRRGKEDPNLKIGDDYHEKKGEFWALKDIDLVIHKGEAIGIIGGNGAGKSTLLKILSRVTTPTEGDVWINGRIASMLEVGTGFHGELTGRENIYMNGAILGMMRKEVDEKIESIIEFSECKEFIDTPVKRYSSGMYVKLAFSVAAHLDAEIMIMDEVLAVGDMSFQRKCLDKMRDVAKKEGRTVLYVSHNMNTIRQLCDRCIVLEKGKLIYDGNVEEAIDIYQNNKEININDVDLDNCPRKVEHHGTSVRLMKFEFGRDNMLDYKEKMLFGLTIQSQLDTDDVCIRVMIYYKDSTPVSMSSTRVGEIQLRKGSNVVQGVLDTSKLAPGIYWLKIAVYNVNDIGQETHYDVVDEVSSFSVKNDLVINNMSWQHNWWGHIVGEDIIIR